MSLVRSLLVCLLVLAPVFDSASGQSPTPAPQRSATPNPAAPLDRYFGTLKMSPIGIRQNIDALARYFGWRTITDEQLVHDAEWVEQALYDWQRQFPHDNWLPPTAFHLMQLYAAVQTQDARNHAIAILHYIIATWPDTTYGHLARVRLAQGFPPFYEEPTMRPTITPSPTPTPFGMTPTPSPTPEPTATPTETPSPTPTPVPTKRPPHALFGR
ncbi:MAG: hypothetical protein JO349_04375 [Candidatus Eremiobacteraeota bacterium]|nr:hypothetical protein [Candidatus Eremiobacteraeota bacterium]